MQVEALRVPGAGPKRLGPHAGRVGDGPTAPPEPKSRQRRLHEAAAPTFDAGSCGPSLSPLRCELAGSHTDVGEPWSSARGGAARPRMVLAIGQAEVSLPLPVPLPMDPRRVGELMAHRNLR